MIIKRLVSTLLPVLAGAALLAGSAQASIILDNFEAGLLPSWTATGNAWSVGGPAGLPVINPPEGSNFARSGAPNATGVLGESNTGTMTSMAFTVTYDTLSWDAAGWSGFSNDGQSYFEILDSGFNVLEKIQTPQSDAWTTLTANLLADGLVGGDTFYFRAVDGNSGNSYSWMAMDNLQLTGAVVSAAQTPEPGTWSMLALSLAGIVFGVRKRRTV
jgi:hypothetical protein